MRIICESCGKKYNVKNDSCPNCGAFHMRRSTATAQESRWSAEPANTGGTPPPAGKFSVLTGKNVQSKIVSALIGRVVAGLIVFLAVSVFGLISRSGRNSSPQPAASSPAASAAVEFSLAELPAELLQDVDALNALIDTLAEEENYSAICEIVLYLYETDSQAADLFANAGATLTGGKDRVLALKALLTAYDLSGEEEDVACAEDYARPIIMIKSKSMSQALELFFAKPMNYITWEDIGTIRYCAVGKTISLSALDPAEVDATEFEISLRTYERLEESSVDRDVAEVGFLYGLHSLQVSRLDVEEEFALFNLRRLREFDASYLRGFEDFSFLSVFPQLEELRMYGPEITSLAGLEQLKRLRALTLSNTALESVAELSMYGNIEDLTLINNEKLGSLSGLPQMEHLKALTIIRQDVMDFNFLEKFYAIERLTISDTRIKDFYPIAQLKTLKELEVTENDDLKSVEGLGGLSNLTSLSIYCNVDKGIDEIAKLTELRTLILQAPKSLQMIGGLSKLEHLETTGGLLENISPVANLTNLRSFTLAGYSSLTNATVYFSLAPLGNLPNLQYVNLAYHDFYGKTAALFQNSAIEYLDLTHCRMDVGTGFGGLKNLKTLLLDKFGALYNVQVWSDGFITSIDYDKRSTDWVAGTLWGLESLEELSMAEMELSNLEFILALPELQRLDVPGNYITEAEPLLACPSLGYVDLRNNPVRNWDIFENLSAMRVICE